MLSNNKIAFILIYLGSFGALFGQEWVIYNSVNSPSLLSNQINCITIEGPKKWIGTSWGLYSMENDEWTNYSEHLPNNDVKCVSIDYNGNVWVGTIGGLSIYNGQEWTTYNNQNSILTNHVNHVVFDENNTAYIGTVNGLYTYDGDFSLVLNESSIEPFVNVRKLAFSGDSLCIGTVNGGLGYLYDTDVYWKNTNNGLIDNTATDLLVDNNKNLWISSPFGGLIAHLSNNTFLSFNSGFFSSWPSNSLTSLFLSDSGIYVGSEGAGFFTFYLENGIPNTTVYNIDNSGLPSNFVRCIKKDEDNVFWIGTNQGLVKWVNVQSIESSLKESSYECYGNKIMVKETAYFSVYSANGKLIYNKRADVLDLNGLSEGFYFVVFNNEFTKKVLVN